jgi:RHS repeat-associated protein
MNRLTQATYADGKVVTWQYDQGLYGIGHLTGMTDRSGSTSWTYDQHGRVLTKQQTTGSLTLTTAMSYDAAGRLARITYPSGTKVNFLYDAAGRISSLRSGGKALVSGVTYQPFGPIAGWIQGNGAIYTRTLDQDGRITGIGLGNGTMALAYDNAGRITDITETGFSAKSFGYDALDRLANYTSGSTALTYKYDGNGNRSSRVNGQVTTTYAIDPASNRLTSIAGASVRTLSYDATGNVTTDSQALVVFGYTYDASGRLVQAKTGGYTTAYTNNGLGERVSRSGYGASLVPGGVEEFVYDAVGHLVGEFDGSGNAIQETVWLANLPVAVLIPGRTPYYVAPDQLGSPHHVTDAGANTVWHWDHDAFGKGVPSGSLAYNLRFPGQYFNSETGLHYNGFRDYDPSTGRYIQTDPIGLRGGLNTYAYVDGSPTSRIDPDGRNLIAIGIACYTVYKFVEDAVTFIDISARYDKALNRCDQKTGGNYEAFKYCSYNADINYIGELGWTFFNPLPGFLVPDPHAFGLGN